MSEQDPEQATDLTDATLDTQVVTLDTWSRRLTRSRTSPLTSWPGSLPLVTDTYGVARAGDRRPALRFGGT